MGLPAQCKASARRLRSRHFRSIAPSTKPRPKLLRGHLQIIWQQESCPRIKKVAFAPIDPEPNFPRMVEVAVLIYD